MNPRAVLDRIFGGAEPPLAIAPAAIAPAAEVMARRQQTSGVMVAALGLVTAVGLAVFGGAAIVLRVYMAVATIVPTAAIAARRYQAARRLRRISSLDDATLEWTLSDDTIWCSDPALSFRVSPQIAASLRAPFALPSATVVRRNPAKVDRDSDAPDKDAK